MEEGSADDLLTFLRRLQEECGGTIPFERYMREALYHPDFGYYAANIKDVGAGGDFSTSSSLESYLGEAIAAWIKKRAENLSWKRIPILEVGAGNGELARSVLQHLGWKAPWMTDYMILETSPILRAQQQSRLTWRGVHWVSSLEEALERSGGSALIFSNELADAFPCRVFEKGVAGWRELGVRITKQGSLEETLLGSPPEDPWLAQFDQLPVGQRVERLDSFRDWMKHLNSLWKLGAMLTIDYGNTADLLYNRRLGGSLRAYFRHERYIGNQVYARFGKQDLTSDVNFGDLIAWGSSLCWKNEPLLTQREFVKKWSNSKENTAPSNRFSSPGEAGDSFQVLEQSKCIALFAGIRTY